MLFLLYPTMPFSPPYNLYIISFPTIDLGNWETWQTYFKYRLFSVFGGMEHTESFGTLVGNNAHIMYMYDKFCQFGSICPPLMPTPLLQGSHTRVFYHPLAVSRHGCALKRCTFYKIQGTGVHAKMTKVIVPPSVQWGNQQSRGT